MPNCQSPNKLTMSSSLTAPIAHHLPSLFFTSLLFTYISATSVQPPNDPCPPFDCGNGVAIGYPFWHQNQQLNHCGYPGFNLSCIDQNPIIFLSNELYSVRKINYSDNTLTLNYLEVKETLICPRIPNDVILSTSSLLNYTSDNRMLRFFYNCTLYPPSHPSIACLRHGAKRSFMFAIGAIPEFDWHAYCESIVTVPVIAKAARADGVLVRGFGQALQDGFKLSWRRPEGACQSCEATGGFCGVSTKGHIKSFFCLCKDGQQYSISCRDKGGILIKFEPNFLAIGALIFGGLIIAATVFYFARSEKVAVYIPVLNRIPSSGK